MLTSSLPWSLFLLVALLGFALPRAGCAPAQRKELLREDFSGPLFNTSTSNWVKGPFMETAAIRTANNTLTFGVVVGDPIGGGDIFTNRRFKSKSGFFRLQFDFRGDAGCTRAFMGWYTLMPNAANYNQSIVFGRHGWLASTQGDYCTGDRVLKQTCDQSFTKLPLGVGWKTYVIEPALELLINYPRNESAIAEGIYLTIESLGATANACYFDNIVLEELIPSTDLPSSTVVSTDNLDVVFKLDSPSFVLQSADGYNNADTARGNFVRMLELNSTNQPQVLRYIPGGNYSVNASSDSTVTFANALPLYGSSLASCEFSFSTFNKDGQVHTGLSIFTAPSDSLEWSITIRDWPFLKTTNTLLLEFRLSHIVSASTGQYMIDELEYVGTEKAYRYTLRAVEDGTNVSLSSGQVLKLIIPLVATVDGVARQIDRPVFTTSAVLTSLATGSPNGSTGTPLSSSQAVVGDRVDTIAFIFPYFANQITYDPNMALLIGRKDSSGGSDDHTLLIVLTTVLVSCALLVVVVAAIAVFVAMKIKASKVITQEQFVQLDHRSGITDHDAL